MGILRLLFGAEKQEEREEILPARCTSTGEEFEILLRQKKGSLVMVEGRKPKKETAGFGEKEGGMAYKTLSLEGGLYPGAGYRCPICGNEGIVRCGKCHRITCYSGKGLFRCAYCGNTGQVSGVMDSVRVYDADEKKPGIKAETKAETQPGMKPGMKTGADSGMKSGIKPGMKQN